MSAEMKNNDSKPALDLEFFREVVGDDKDFEKELFEIFLDNSKKNISLMEEAVQSEDGNAWYMASHAFKGSCASIGAFDLSKLLQEAQINNESDTVTKNNILKRVKEGFKEVELIISAELN